jgi:hypothetical protein
MEERPSTAAIDFRFERSIRRLAWDIADTVVDAVALGRSVEISESLSLSLTNSRPTISDERGPGDNYGWYCHRAASNARSASTAVHRGSLGIHFDGSRENLAAEEDVALVHRQSLKIQLDCFFDIGNRLL